MSTMDNGGNHTFSRSRKKLSQRLYRSTEAEDFEQLRQIIQEITKESPLTRHDVLIKAIGIIRHLDREYRSLLTEHVTALVPTCPSGSSTPQPTFYPSAPQFPAESWSMNHNVQPMSMDPHMLPSQSSNNIAYSTYDRHNMYAMHNYYGSPTNH
ncbi:uncharacterized protein F5147DRAFT_772289 [Suillus discolor]|uniref:BHLH domain-containing protein n=1 Tax=Suillus discolor TaxID=1912936 RepID=A0A9P7JVB9_9AGAM|nr:uncharacterized protein F5147DRAFT_772289 [Suillus discolor]KAG2110510.1 hypothetical protein F5147DRAFT_772289 [Suillus discolor]